MFKTWDNKADSVEEKNNNWKTAYQTVIFSSRKKFTELEIDYFDVATEISLIVERLETKIKIYGGINYHGLIVEKCD